MDTDTQTPSTAALLVGADPGRVRAARAAAADAMRSGSSALEHVRAETMRALECFAADDAVDPVDTRAALSDAMSAAWYAADCPPSGTRASALVLRVAVECFSSWHAWWWSADTVD